VFVHKCHDRLRGQTVALKRNAVRPIVSAMDDEARKQVSVNSIPNALTALAECGEEVFFPKSLKLLFPVIEAPMISWGVFSFYPRPMLLSKFFESEQPDFEETVKKIPWELINSQLFHYPLVGAMTHGDFAVGSIRTVGNCMLDPRWGPDLKAQTALRELLTPLGFERHGCLLVSNNASIAVALSFFRNGSDFSAVECTRLLSLKDDLRHAVATARTASWMNRSNQDSVAVISAKQDGEIEKFTDSARELLSAVTEVRKGTILPAKVINAISQARLEKNFSKGNVLVVWLEGPRFRPISIHIVDDGDSIRLAFLSRIALANQPPASLTSDDVKFLTLHTKMCTQDKSTNELSLSREPGVGQRFEELCSKVRLGSKRELVSWFRLIGSVACRDEGVEIKVLHGGLIQVP
jgi:hypothetical protein